MEKVSMSYLFSFSRRKKNVLLRSYLADGVTNFKIYLGSISKAMADWEKTRGRWKYKNLNISRRKRAFQMK